MIVKKREWDVQTKESDVTFKEYPISRNIRIPDPDPDLVSHINYFKQLNDMLTRSSTVKSGSSQVTKGDIWSVLETELLSEKTKDFGLRHTERKGSS